MNRSEESSGALWRQVSHPICFQSHPAETCAVLHLPWFRVAAHHAMQAVAASNSVLSVNATRCGDLRREEAAGCHCPEHLLTAPDVAWLQAFPPPDEPGAVPPSFEQAGVSRLHLLPRSHRRGWALWPEAPGPKRHQGCAKNPTTLSLPPAPLPRDDRKLRPAAGSSPAIPALFFLGWACPIVGPATRSQMLCTWACRPHPVPWRAPHRAAVPEPGALPGLLLWRAGAGGAGGSGWPGWRRVAGAAVSCAPPPRARLSMLLVFVAGQPRPPAREAALPRRLAVDRAGDDSPHGETAHLGPATTQQLQSRASCCPRRAPRWLLNRQPAPCCPAPCRSCPIPTRRRGAPRTAAATATPAWVSRRCRPHARRGLHASAAASLALFCQPVLPCPAPGPQPCAVVPLTVIMRLAAHLLLARAAPPVVSPAAGVEDIEPLEARLKEAGVEYTRSMSGRPAIFFRDPGERRAAVLCPWRLVPVARLGAWGARSGSALLPRRLLLAIAMHAHTAVSCHRPAACCYADANCLEVVQIEAWR